MIIQPQRTGPVVSLATSVSLCVASATATAVMLPSSRSLMIVLAVLLMAWSLYILLMSDDLPATFRAGRAHEDAAPRSKPLGSLSGKP